MLRSSATSSGRFLVAVALLGAALVGQRQRARAGEDPYTRAEPAVLDRLGYVSLGPFELGAGHDTRAVEELLGTEPVVWIETAHFHLGCSLSPLALRGQQDWSKEWVQEVRAELDELRPLLPKGRLKKRVKSLDPWLRAHLTARRLERLYAEVCAVLGRDDAWFADGSHNANRPEEFTGEGPYLGMRQKPFVLVLQKRSALARYTRQYRGRETVESMRHHDLEFGGMFWGCSQESANNLFQSDYALHASLAFNVAHNLYTSYRCFGHDLPPWLVTGLAHLHSRRVTPRFPNYDRRDPDDRRDRSPFWDWDARVAGLVKNDVFGPLAELVRVDSAGKFGIEQHMQSWAVVDYLASERSEELARLLFALKAPFHGRLRTPTGAELQQRQQEAIAAAFGVAVDAVDGDWRAFVRKNRSKRRRRR
ncbi:MAG: hypothetical protein ACON4Z_03545 [Planctomycetota bacterium]